MTALNTPPRPVVLCILDGWGLRADTPDNAITCARTPTLDRLTALCPTAQLEASETFVGLPSGQMGNSEVGHMNLGAGRVVLQDLPRIDRAIETGALQANPALQKFIRRMKDSGGTVHLLGLLSDGGVHSHQNHMVALAQLLRTESIPVKIHAILDGRDTPPKSALFHLEAFMKAAPEAGIATVSGRYYAMDRDKNWDRVERAYAALVTGKGERATSAKSALETAYANGQTDEFVLPAVLGDYTGMADGDSLLMANFRADRVREILSALADPDFDGFARSQTISFAARLGMVEYSRTHNQFLETLFPPDPLKNGLGEVVATHGLKQLRIAETEKYAHVTFFLNGGGEAAFPGEERILVPSPKVATYDQQPEMAAPEVTDKLVAAVESGRFDLIVVNYANTDMVGHTGVQEAAVRAVETVDACLGRVEQAVTAAGGVMLITADHGNAEQMRDANSNQPHTAHTLNPVPLILTGRKKEAVTLSNGRLADVAPTLLSLLRLPQPEEMTGRVLIK